MQGEDALENENMRAVHGCTLPIESGMFLE